VILPCRAQLDIIILSEFLGSGGVYYCSNAKLRELLAIFEKKDSWDSLSSVRILGARGF